MENNRISAVIVAHLIMKKETIRHIFVICDTEPLKLFTQLERHTRNNNHSSIVKKSTSSIESKMTLLCD